MATTTTKRCSRARKKKKNICTVLLQVERQSLNTSKLWLSRGIFDNGQGIGVQNSCQPPTFLGPNLGTSMTCSLNAPWNGLSHIDCMYRVLYKWDWPGVQNCSWLNCCLCCDPISHTGSILWCIQFNARFGALIALLSIINWKSPLLWQYSKHWFHCNRVCC